MNKFLQKISLLRLFMWAIPGLLVILLTIPVSGELELTMGMFGILLSLGGPLAYLVSSLIEK